MRRRIFLKRSLWSAAAIAGPSIGTPQTPEPSAAADEEIAQTLSASMIWAADVGGAGAPFDSDRLATHYAPGMAATPDLHAAFLAEFEVAHTLADARLHLFAYTRYRLYLNGRYVGRGPARFQNQRPEYDSWPVATHLRPGRNTLAVLVHRDSPSGRIMAHAPGLAALLRWTDAAGVAHTVRSDERWRAREDRSFGPRKTAWSSIEETIDARLSDDWTAAAYRPQGWLAAVRVGDASFMPLAPRSVPLLRETSLPLRGGDALPRTVAPGDQIALQLERTALAYCRLLIDAEAGAAFEIAFVLDDGAVTGTNRYTARAGQQRYESGDVFALRRLQIRVIKGRATLREAELVEVVYPFEQIGRFACDDPALEAIWAMCARSLPLLSEDAYIDCADRERVEWIDNTPPAYQVTRVMMSGPEQHWADGRLQRALLLRAALSQTADGQLKAHTCSERWDIHAIMEDRSCDWLISLRDYYDASGDTALVRQLWPHARRLLAWFYAQRTARGLVLAREWEVWDNPLRYQRCEGAGLNALLCRALKDAAYLSMQIGALHDAVRYRRDAAALGGAINAQLWDERAGAYSGALFGPGSARASQLNGKVFDEPLDGQRYRPTLQAALFALYADIVPASRRARLIAWILAHRDQAEAIMTHHYLFEFLYTLQRADADADVLDRMRRGWRAMAAAPGGLSWEALTDSGGSKLHIYGIVPAYFLAAYLLGVRPDGPIRRRRLLIDPRPATLQRAEGVVVTEFGPVPIAWRRQADGGLRIEGTIPPGVGARLRLPHGSARAPELDGKPARSVRDGHGNACLELGAGGFVAIV